MIHTQPIAERAGIALGHVARGNAMALRRLEATLAPGKRAEYFARRNALHVMALAWGVERLHAQVAWADAVGRRNARELLAAVLDPTQKVASFEIEQSLRNAATEIAGDLEAVASRLVGLELALDDIAKQFHFDGRAVRLMVNVERFVPAEIEVDSDAVAEVRQTITVQLTQDLDAMENRNADA